MKTRFALALALVAAIGLLFGSAGFSADASLPEQRAATLKMFQAGNYKDAFEGYKKLALNPQNEPAQVGPDLQMAMQALANLGRVDEQDELREAVAATHAGQWRALWGAGESYMQSEHYGYIVAGKFYRGHKRGGGRMVNTFERDRVRSLQLFKAAMDKLAEDKGSDQRAKSDFYMAFARTMLSNQGWGEAWRLQYLSNLAELPDYVDGWYYGRRNQGAPVGPDGQPIYYSIPKSYQDAANDGERWRWCLLQALELSPARTNEVRWHLAEFSQSQFGEQTMAQYGYFFGRRGEDDTKKNESGTFALHTIGEDETIARLATGIKRFKLPDEFNYVKIFQQIADEPKTGYGEQALGALGQVFENRRQYDRAAEYWKRNIKEYGPGHDNYKQKRLAQIIGNWGRFEPLVAQPAGTGATIDFRFRNGKKVAFEAHEILVDKLLTDLKAYLRSSPPQLDWNKTNLGNIGYRLVQQNETQYLGEKKASWELELEPREHHFDARVTVATPLQKAGAYLVTAKMADGNTSRIIVWLADTAIVKKPMPDKTYYFVGDAGNGSPVAKANVEFFGYKQRHIEKNRYAIDVTNFAENTDADGQIMLGQQAQSNQFQWLITARTPEGRLAYLGFTNVWFPNHYEHEYNQTKVFSITDRPVYRPAQSVKFKFWVGNAKYDQPEDSQFAKRTYGVEVRSPKGEKVLEKDYTTDTFGGLEGEFELASGATLGAYHILLKEGPNGIGAGHFRVEEYKKPEYEVTVEAPKEPIMLGEKVTAMINARYYFGAPVQQAKVKYKVMRTSNNEQWYPIGPWDWMYGRGYWWFAYDCRWLPGWQDWGCKRPMGWWWGGVREQPELVAEAEVEIQADGTLPVTIDTTLAKEIHPDQDHTYTITAEVVDQSRRTIVGSGTVMVARKPFKVFAWVDRGYYRTGDDIHAYLSAHTLDKKPVVGKGELKLLQISYEKDKKTGELVAVQTPVQTWKVDTDAQGQAQQQIKAAEAGQYRLSYSLTDDQKHTIEGGYVFTIIGPDFDGKDFRFNDLELVNDKQDYKPGEKVKLQVNSNQTNGTVLLFIKPANGVYLAPRVIRLKGKSAIEEIEVAQKDMPNFFLEAITVHGGRLHAETKEIIVPPEKRVLNVEVTPSSETYKPGEKGKIKLKLTDFAGKAFVGSTVMTVYDKSVEYISGGSNVPEIKEFFWKWRRNHYPRSETNLAAHFMNLLKQNEIGMSDLGVFGGSVADELAKNKNGELGDNRRHLKDGLAEQGAAKRSGAPMAPGMALGAKAETSEKQQSDRAAGEDKPGAGAEAPPANLVEPTVRKNFADTAKWVASITTDKEGIAEIPIDMPENLTTWKIRVWGMGAGTRVGQGESEAITRKDLIVRLQSPRFFVQKDEVVLSANVHNYLKAKKAAQVTLELEGKTLSPMGKTTATVSIDAGGEQRVDFRVKVLEEGQAIIRMKAQTDVESDAMEMTFPVFVHGMLKTDSYSGVIRSDKNSAEVMLTVPKDRRMNESRLEVRYSPTLAGAMVDALPYMVDFPYGCTEQTLNRFLPTVITQKILLDMGLDLKAIEAKRTNLSAQEIGDDVERAKGWKRFDRNPVFDQGEVTAMVKDGLKRLTDMQCSDGGWGWFNGYGEQSWPHTTAYVVHGLQLAQQNDVALVPGVLENGTAWLQRYQDKQVQMLKNAPTKTKPWKDRADDVDAFVYMVLVDGKVENQAMQDFLYRDRTHLAVYTKAMFGLALHKQKVQDKLDMILENISQYVVQDPENQTAYLKLPADNYWWYWYGSEYEAQGYYLKLLSKTDPKGDVASGLVKYLLNNRKHATYWNSTRDTAICVEAMAEYLKASGESKPDMTVEVWLDGKKQKEVKITAQDLFTFDNKFVLFGDAVTDGQHKLELRRQGTGPVYFNAYLTNFTLEDYITKAGLEVKVNRKYFKLTKVDKSIKTSGSRGQAVDQKVEKYDRSELANLAPLKSGDLVEIELEIDSKNDYEYLLFEDMKASGFEPVDLRSGYNSNSLGAYMELRDERVCFFVRALARGKHSVSYRMRAEIPGKFSALPTRASAMYAPELKGNSDEIKLQIED